MLVDLSADCKALRRNLNAFARDQLPFATARALTKLAQMVQEAETEALESTFDRPSPFTRRAFGVKAALKHTPVAVVFARSIQSSYLEPYEFSGWSKLGRKRAMLTPKNVPLNQYGNLPRGKLKALKASPNVFVGSVTFKKSGETVSGVWRRPGRARRNGKMANAGSLQLLVRFTDPRRIESRMDYRSRAETILRKNFRPVLDREIGLALATAR